MDLNLRSIISITTLRSYLNVTHIIWIHLIWEPSILLYISRAHYFVSLSTIPLLNILHFVYLWNTSWMFGYFQLRAITNKAGWTLMYKVLYGVKFPLSLYFLNTHQWDGWLILQVSLPHMWNDIPNSSSILHFHQHSVNILVPVHPHHVWLSVFLILANLICV